MKTDFKALSKSKGYKSLKKAVLWDIRKEVERNVKWEGRKGLKTPCFNPAGSRCCGNKECRETDACFTFRWVIGRAEHYAHKTGLSVIEILDNWEERRSYWYRNYYQDANQPKLRGNDIKVLETEEELKDLAKDGFVCPACGGVSTNPFKCDSGLSFKASKSGICDWKIYGLFGGLGKDVFVFIREQGVGFRIFKPVGWE